MEERIVFLNKWCEDDWIHKHKNEVGSFHHTRYKKEQRPKCNV